MKAPFLQTHLQQIASWINGVLTLHRLDSVEVKADEKKLEKEITWLSSYMLYAV